MSCDKNRRRPYICGPWTELDYQARDGAKTFYSKLTEICEEVLQTRGFVPHEEYDPVKMANLSLKTIFHNQREIIIGQTSVLIVCSLEPAWSGGVEIAWANEYSVPIVILIQGNNKLPPLLKGGPMVFDILHYDKEEQALLLLKASLLDLDEYYAKRNQPLDHDNPPVRPPQAGSVVRDIQKDMRQLNLLAEDPLAAADWHKKITEPDSSQ